MSADAHTHACSCPGCPKRIPLNLLMCMTHWRMVPAKVQREVLATWRARLRRPDEAAIEAHETQVAAAVAAVTSKLVRKIAPKDTSERNLFE